MHLKAEAFDHHEAREDHEDLPPRAGHELQRIIEPVAAAQHHFLVLHRGRLELRIGQHGGECDGDGNAPADHIDDAVAEAQRLPQRHDREIGHQRGQRARGHEPADHARGVLNLQPLQLQRLVHRLVVVEPDGAEHGDRQDTAHGGEIGRDRRGRAQKRERDQPQHLLAHEEQDGDDTDGEEARDLAHRMQQSDVGPVEIGDLDNEVIEQRRPCVEGDRHGQRHEEQQGHGTAPERQALGLFEGDKTGHGNSLRPRPGDGERKGRSGSGAGQCQTGGWRTRTFRWALYGSNSYETCASRHSDSKSARPWAGLALPGGHTPLIPGWCARCKRLGSQLQ